MANSLWSPILQAQENAIAIMTRKKQLAEEKRQFDERLKAMKVEKDVELQKKAMEIVAEAKKAQVDYAKTMMKEAYSKGDTQGVQAFGETLRKEGFQVPAREAAGPAQPGQLPPVQYFSAPPDPNRGPGSISGALARLYSDNPQKLTELFSAQHQKPGTRLEVGPDGKISFSQGTGVDPAMQLTKTQQGNIQGKSIDAANGIKRMEGIVQSFKPEFLQIPNKIGAEWTALKEKLNMGAVSDKDQKFLEEYSVFKQNSLDNINLYIKEITGAQMSEKEADRIRRSAPDPGDGIVGGDSPTQFKSKLVNTYKKTKSALARYNYYLKMGVPEQSVKDMINNNSAMSLDDVEKIMNDRADQIKKDNPSATMQQIANQIKSEFGL